MTFWKILFTKTKKSKKGVLGSEPLSKEASNYISEALGIIESHMEINVGMVGVKSTGAGGKVMAAVRKFDAAFQLHPENPLLHYAYASCLHLAMQFKSAEDEMKKCSETHPDFILANLALEGWERWQPVFTLPPWGIKTKTVHPYISKILKTSIMRAVRDGIVPRATLFLRDAQGDFQNLQALRSARITLASVISPVNDPQVIGVYAKIYDDPSNPYIFEEMDIPFRPRGDKVRSRYEYLCIQENIDFVVIDRNDHIILNRRLPIPKNMQKINKKIFKMLEASEGVEISDSQLIKALMSHQQKFEPSDVHY